MISTRPILRNFEVAFAGTVLFLMTGAVVVLAHQKSPRFDINTVANDNSLVRYGFFGAYIVMAFLLIPRVRLLGTAMLADPPFLALLVLIVASVSWSFSPYLSMQRAVAVLLTAIFGYYLAVAFPAKMVIRLITFALGISMILSLLVIVLLPEWGNSTLGWRGVFLFKNNLGRQAALTLLFAWILIRDPDGGRLERRFLQFLAILSLVLLIGSQARSALVVTLFVGVVLALLPTETSRRGVRSGLFFVVTSVVIVLYLAGLRTSAALALLGKDEDLTGRTPLWGYVLESISQKPMLGYGYSGFWGGAMAPSEAIWQYVPWRPKHAHNGVLDMWLDLGAIGVILLFASLTLTAVWCVRGIRSGGGTVPLFGLTFVLFMIASSTTESVFLKSNVISTCLLVFIAVTVRQPAASAGPYIGLRARPQYASNSKGSFL